MYLPSKIFRNNRRVNKGYECVCVCVYVRVYVGFCMKNGEVIFFAEILLFHREIIFDIRTNYKCVFFLDWKNDPLTCRLKPSLLSVYKEKIGILAITFYIR